MRLPLCVRADRPGVGGASPFALLEAVDEDGDVDWQSAAQIVPPPPAPVPQASRGAPPALAARTVAARAPGTSAPTRKASTPQHRQKDTARDFYQAFLNVYKDVKTGARMTSCTAQDVICFDARTPPRVVLEASCDK